MRTEHPDLTVNHVDDLADVPSTAHLTALHDRLAAASDRDGLLDVAYRTIDSPVGALLLAATPAGVVRVAFEREDHDAVLHSLATAVSPRVLRAPGRTGCRARCCTSGRRGDGATLAEVASYGARPSTPEAAR